MKSILVIALLIPTLALVSCGTEEETPPDTTVTKGVVDVAALAAACTVSLSGNIGEVTVPMSTAVPTIAGATLEAAVAAAVTFTVTNNDTSVSVNLTEGAMVATAPAALGEWAWEINAARDEIAITFYNQSSAGALAVGGNYSASLTVASNSYIADVAATAFDVTVQ